MKSAQKRVIGVDPTTQGFGFAVLEGPHLVDWGVCHVGSSRADAATPRFGDLMARYTPAVVAAEDCGVKTSRRGTRARLVIAHLQTAAASVGTEVALISRHVVRRHLGSSTAVTKHGIATVLAERFAGLDHRRPRNRKPWMSEDARMPIFTALSFAVVAADRLKRQQPGPEPGRVRAQADRGVDP